MEQALYWTGADEPYRDRPVAELSGGERQRAFLGPGPGPKPPKVLLLDEPTTFLDIHYQLQLLDLLKRLNQQQQALYHHGAPRRKPGSAILRSHRPPAPGQALGRWPTPRSADPGN